MKFDLYLLYLLSLLFPYLGTETIKTNFLLAVLLLAGCWTKPVLQAPMNNGSQDSPRAEMRIGDGPDVAPHPSFKITTVREHQKPSADAPYHIDGGEWTFFDCHASGDPKVVFTVGTASKSSDGNSPSAGEKAFLIVKDRDSFSPNGRFAVYQDRSTISALPLDQPAGLSSMKTTGALSAQSASSR